MLNDVLLVIGWGTGWCLAAVGLVRWVRYARRRRRFSAKIVEDVLDCVVPGPRGPRRPLGAGPSTVAVTIDRFPQMHVPASIYLLGSMLFGYGAVAQGTGWDNGVILVFHLITGAIACFWAPESQDDSNPSASIEVRGNLPADVMITRGDVLVEQRLGDIRTGDDAFDGRHLVRGDPIACQSVLPPTARDAWARLLEDGWVLRRGRISKELPPHELLDALRTHLPDLRLVHEANPSDAIDALVHRARHAGLPGVRFRALETLLRHAPEDPRTQKALSHALTEGATAGAATPLDALSPERPLVAQLAGLWLCILRGEKLAPEVLQGLASPPDSLLTDLSHRQRLRQTTRDQHGGTLKGRVSVAEGAGGGAVSVAKEPVAGALSEPSEEGQR